MTSPTPPLTCPVCQAVVATRPPGPAFPFCGDRCRLIDLGRWLGGEYRVSRPLTEDDLADLPGKAAGGDDDPDA